MTLSSESVGRTLVNWAAADQADRRHALLPLGEDIESLLAVGITVDELVEADLLEANLDDGYSMADQAVLLNRACTPLLTETGTIVEFW